jgi:2'-5' RNA ligase
MLSIQRAARLSSWKPLSVTRRCVWYAGYENSKEANEIAAEIDKLLEQMKGIADRLKRLQQEY